jgi:hypothetical protein
MPLVVLAAELSWCVARPDASAQRSVQPASSGQAPSPFSTLPGRQPWRRSPVRVQQAASTYPVSSSKPWLSGRPVSGPSGVRSPGFVVRGPAFDRLVSTRPVSIRPVSTPSVRTRPAGPPPGGGGGDRPMRQGNPHHGNGSRSLRAAAPRRPAARSTAESARTRATPPGVARGRPGLSVVDPGRVGCGRRPRLTLPPRQARPACRAPVAGGCARAGRRPQREVAVPAAWLPPSGWVGDHGAWWSWRPARRVDGPGGPMRVEPGIGVRPQRGPGWQRALPARYRQRCDLR